MKKIIIAIVSIMMGVSVFAERQHLSAVMSWASFCTPEGTSYVESYISFNAWSMEFRQEEDGLYYAKAELVLEVTQGDSSFFYRKYLLMSPGIHNLDSRGFSYLDVQRFALPNGTYTLHYSIRDIAVDAEPTEVTDKIWVNYNAKTPSTSTLELLARISPTENENVLSRNGYDMEPYADNHYPNELNVIQAYCEIYNIDKEIFGDDFMTVSYIEVKETGRHVGTPQVQRFKGAHVVPVVTNLDIATLPSGNYNLVMEVRNRDNQAMLITRTDFTRVNNNVKEDRSEEYVTSFAAQITDENLLNYYLDALYPISSSKERDWVVNAIKTPGYVAEKQAFLYDFWVGRGDLDPEAAWREYRIRLDYVSANFSYPRTPGYLTDRGRVYLQYGAPDYVRDEKNFVSFRYLTTMGQIHYLPYQLWRYNTLPGDDPNRVFLFWDEFRSGYYRLLQSNARGEVQDPLWERTLTKQQLNEDVMGEVGEQFERGY